MKLELATQNDFDAIIAFYDDVTKNTSSIERYARWSKGKHPTVEGIKAYIDEGSMYISIERTMPSSERWLLPCIKARIITP